MIGTDELRDWVAGRSWYHTIELQDGVVTPGWFDLRTVAPKVPFGDLAGTRCLDVGTFDGFWAFTLEGRGATDVITIDELDPQRWDWPVGSRDATAAAIADRHRGGEAFPRLKTILGSRVERHHCNVYDLGPERFGLFEVVYVGSILLHLRDPVRALERIASVTAPGGRVFVLDAIDLELTLAHPYRAVAHLDGVGRPWWWKPNMAALARMVTDAGLTLASKPVRLFMPAGAGQPTAWPKGRGALRRDGRETAVLHRFGDPHGLVVARRSP
jgi:tRNA (mo5U34)-methyltransferase